MPDLSRYRPRAEQMRLPETVNRQIIQEIIDQWVIGNKAERDREILYYFYIDGLTYEQIANRYQDRHPDCPVSVDTIKRAVRKREQIIFKHFPG